MMIRWVASLSSCSIVAVLNGCAGTGGASAIGFVVPSEAVIVDLTHMLDEPLEIISKDSDSFELQTPQGPDLSPDMVQSFKVGARAGTYFESPAATIRGQPGVGRVNPAFFVAPMVLIDITAKVIANPDYQLEIKDLTDWMNRNGEIPAGAVIVMRSGWDLRWGRLDERADPPISAFLSPTSEGYRYPGIHPEVARFLVETGIDIQGVAVDTATVERGLDSGSREVSQILHRAGRWTAAKLTNLDRLPASGAVLWVAPLKIGSTGSAPARIMALVPR